MKSDRDIYITAVRRGDFVGLLALVDHLAEAGDSKSEAALDEWKHTEFLCRISVRRHLAGKSKKGAAEWVTRNLYWLLRRMSPYLGQKWHRTKNTRKSVPWKMAAKMADGMYQRTLREIRAETRGLTTP